METKELLDEFSKAILDGTLDNKLDHIGEIVRIRKGIQTQIMASSLDKGDKVKFIPKTRPKYLANAIGTIMSRQGDKFVVDLDAPRRGYNRTFFKGIVTPASLIERI